MESKNYTIEYMKAFSTILIFLSHSAGNGFLTPLKNGNLGACGVSFFIVLSGYLAIYTNKDKTNEKILPYLCRKIKMVYPLHVFMIICALPFSAWSVIIGLLEIKKLLLQLFLDLAMIQSFFPDESLYLSLNSVSWYLSVYLLCTLLTIPLAKLMSKLIKSKRTAWLIIIIIFVIQFSWTSIFKDTPPLVLDNIY